MVHIILMFRNTNCVHNTVTLTRCSCQSCDHCKGFQMFISTAKEKYYWRSPYGTCHTGLAFDAKSRTFFIYCLCLYLPEMRHTLVSVTFHPKGLICKSVCAGYWSYFDKLYFLSLVICTFSFYFLGFYGYMVLYYPSISTIFTLHPLSYALLAFSSFDSLASMLSEVHGKNMFDTILIPCFAYCLSIISLLISSIQRVWFLELSFPTSLFNINNHSITIQTRLDDFTFHTCLVSWGTMVSELFKWSWMIKWATFVQNDRGSREAAWIILDDLDSCQIACVHARWLRQMISHAVSYIIANAFLDVQQK